MAYTKNIPIETIEPIGSLTSGGMYTEEMTYSHISKSKKKEGCGWGMGVGMLFLCLAALFLGILIILGLIHPAFVSNPITDDLDWGKLILASFIFALLGTIIVWIIASCS